MMHGPRAPCRPRVTSSLHGLKSAVKGPSSKLPLPREDLFGPDGDGERRASGSGKQFPGRVERRHT